MQEEDALTGAQREMEAALGRLRPSAPRIDRDALMFRAGRASMRRRGYVWQGLAAGLAVCLGLSLAFRPAVRGTQDLAMAPRPAEPAQTAWQFPTPPADAESAPSPRGEYLHLRDLVLAGGIDALPDPAYTGPAERPLTIRSILDGMRQSPNHRPGSAKSPAWSGQGDEL